MKKKIIIISSIIVVVAACAATSIFFLNKKGKSSKKETVAATYTEYILQSAENFEYSNMYGRLESGGSQNVYISEEDTLGQILVKVGDKVSIGTPLVTLDANKLKLDLDSCNLKVQQDDISIAQTTKLITKYQNAKPMVENEINENDEPSIPDEYDDNLDDPDINDEDTIDPSTILSEIDSFDKRVDGDGSSDNPFIFNCTGDCTIKSNVFKNIIKKKYYVNLHIYSEDLDEFQYTCIIKPPANSVKVPKDYSWSIGKIQVLSDGCKVIQLNDELPIIPCDYEVYTSPDDANSSDLDDSDIDDSDIDDSDIDDSDIDDSDVNPDLNGNIDNQYTREELDDLIKEQTTHLAELQLEKRQDQIEVRKAQSKYDEATIKSTMEGVVTVTDANAVSSDPVVTVSSGTGLYVKTAIDEYTYPSVKIGDEIQVVTWTDEGEVSLNSKITEISPYPSNNNEFSNNNNISYYPVTAYIEKSNGLIEGDYVNVKINPSEENSSCFVEGAYLGKDKKGSFIYVAGDDYILHKLYVKTGKVMYGYTEIKDLKPDEYLYIASPYTKNVKSGAKANPDEDMYMEE